ncbi:MAG: CDP-diacylglycerol--serine O-phosphatidyltransferase [Alistipes sp.]
MKIRLFTIPNSITLCNLFCGSCAAVSALVYNDLAMAFWLIIAAAIFDFFDGFVARLLKSYSEVGAQLDSLADVISFGFAPAAVLFTLYRESESLWQWSETVQAVGGLALFVVAIFSALRLAKFNVDETQTTEFCGLPVPANALLLVSIGMLAQTRGLELPREALLAIAGIMSWLLIAPVRMFALKFHGFGWRGNELRYGFMLLSAVLVFVLGYFSIPVIIIAYILISTVRWIVTLNRRGSDACDRT